MTRVCCCTAIVKTGSRYVHRLQVYVTLPNSDDVLGLSSHVNALSALLDDELRLPDSVKSDIGETFVRYDPPPQPTLTVRGGWEKIHCRLIHGRGEVYALTRDRSDKHLSQRTVSDNDPSIGFSVAHFWTSESSLHHTVAPKKGTLRIHLRRPIPSSSQSHYATWSH